MKSNKAVVKVMQAKAAEKNIAPLVEEMIAALGEDPKRDGLLRTPDRVDKAMKFLTSGYRMDIQKILNGALYEVKYDEMVVVKDIEFFSMCEHHMLPFFGKVHVAYLPKNRVIGLSKIPRIVDVFARRLQIQERHDAGDRADDPGGGGPGGRRRDLRGAALLHDDARRREAALGGDDERDAGGVPRAQRDARRVSGVGESPKRVMPEAFYSELRKLTRSCLSCA